VYYRVLGHSGVRISTLVLGTMTFGGIGAFKAVGSSDVDEARRLVDRALDAGVNLIDTADIYSDGRSEEIVGEVMRGRRDRALLATKARFPTGNGPNEAGLSRHHLIEACEASLRRLQTDHIDLYQVHEWDGETPLDETLEALDTLLSQGKIRYIGCSNYAAWQMMKALWTSDRSGVHRFVSQQIYYSLIHREAEYEIIPSAVDQGVGILVWSPLAGGLLSGKYRRGEDAPAGARHTTKWGEPPVEDWDRAYDIIHAVIDVAEGQGVSPARIALAYLLGRPGVTGVIMGARREEQLEDNLASIEIELSVEERSRLDKASAPPLIYPFWHQARTASDRLSAADRVLLDGRGD
jgi:aryl-alcohol dehydrogenase-like predicted oxidoreductase